MFRRPTNRLAMTEATALRKRMVQKDRQYGEG